MHGFGGTGSAGVSEKSTPVGLWSCERVGRTVLGGEELHRPLPRWAGVPSSSRISSGVPSPSHLGKMMPKRFQLDKLNANLHGRTGSALADASHPGFRGES